MVNLFPWSWHKAMTFFDFRLLKNYIRIPSEKSVVQLLYRRFPSEIHFSGEEGSCEGRNEKGFVEWRSVM